MKLGFAASLGGVTVADFVKGTFHQHATQPWKSCHRAANDIDACGGDMLHEQDDGGTDADTLLAAISASGRGYSFVGLIGNEEPATDPKKTHNLVTLSVTENQIGAMCTKGDKHCKNPCNPVPPSGSGPWTTIDINNLHREYIQDVPGYFVQHPTTDPQRDQILAQMKVDKNLRGMEVYNSWVDQAWDTVMPYNDVDIDPLHPVYQSTQCLAWVGTKGGCQLDSPMYYWDATLRSAKRPIYGLADDDGFVYTGDSDDPVYKHGKNDVQTDTASWFRFGQAWNMVDVPSDFVSSDVSGSVDAGNFYASSGVELSYNISNNIIDVVATEPVVYGVAGGVGSASGSDPLAALNITLCISGSDHLVTNVGCNSGGGPPPAVPRLRLDLTQVSGSFFYTRVQAMVRTRYPISAVPSSKSKKWEFTLANTPNPADVLEGRLLRATGDSRRPFLVQSSSGSRVQVVSSFSDGWGDITPDSTSVTGIVAGQDQLVSERWAWMQPVFRKATASGLVDPFSVSVVV